MIRARVYYSTWVIILVLAATFASYKAALGVRYAYRQIFPDVSILRSMYPVPVGKIDGRIVFRFQKERPRNWLPLQAIPRKAVAAVLMSEDSGFFQHKGYEPEAIRAAIEHNSKPGVKIKRGGSTITQQLVKNLFLSPEKTLTRKARELLLSVELERKVSKRRILEAYLNVAEWGPGTYGISAASQRYFHKPVADLTAHDGAVLAFMLPNPTRYRHSVRDGELTAFAAKRVETILERLWKTGKISDEEYTSAGIEEALPSSL